jgi:hypothetical protein
MHKKTFAFVAITCWALAGLTVAHATETPAAQHFFILLQDTASGECRNCGLLAKPLFDGLIALDAKARRNDLAAQYSELKARLPALNVPDAVRAAFCEKLSLAPGAGCDRVTVISDQPAAKVAEPVANLASGDHVVRLSIEYARHMRFNELRVIAALSQVTPDHKLGKATLYAWYVTPGTEATPASPLEAASKAATPKQQAARSYWFEGAPSRMENELLRAFAEIAENLRLSLPYVANQSWSSLPTLADLKAAGKIDCKGASCKFASLKATETRLSFVQMADAPVVMSVPIELWR